MPKSRAIDDDQQDSQVREFIAGNRGKRLELLSTDAQTFFEFLVLIVDIKYRNKYGKTFDDRHNESYSVDVQSEGLADQVSPVDNDLLGQ